MLTPMQFHPCTLIDLNPVVACYYFALCGRRSSEQLPPRQAAHDSAAHLSHGGAAADASVQCTGYPERVWLHHRGRAVFGQRWMIRTRIAA